jgi:hypothetical protein
MPAYGVDHGVRRRPVLCTIAHDTPHPLLRADELQWHGVQPEGLGRILWEETHSPRGQDQIDDQIDVTSRAFLGMTVACARCHDHKFDPIPTKDYYSLYGVFASCNEPGEKPLLGENRNRPYTSRFTGAAAVPYVDAVFPGHPYTGASLEQDLQTVIERIHPSLILAPSPLDEHEDHRATGLAVQDLSRRAGSSALPVRYWVVHCGDGWPTPRGLLPGVPLTPSPRGAVLAPLPFVLEPPEEDRKLEAVRLYETQMKAMAPFLLAFVRTTELFSVRGTADLAAP